MVGTYTFSPPLDALQEACDVYLELQTTEDDISDPAIASFLNYINNSGTTTSFDFRIGTGVNLPPVAGTTFIMHWLAVEKTASTAVDLP